MLDLEPAPLTGGGSGGLKIRPAVASDLADLLAMGREFFREAGHEKRGLKFDAESFAATLKILGESGVLILAERDGVAAGMAATDIAPAYWNRDVKLAQEIFWYLRPEHRKGYGGRLLRALESVATAKGAIFLAVVAEAGARADALGRHYLSTGYELAETVYRKRLAPCR